MTAQVALAGERVPLKTQARAGELIDLLAGVSGEVRRVSLDCFDTILVRNVAEPVDVFFDLAHSEPFARLGFAAQLRARAESQARSLAKLRRGSIEVTLPEIYQAAFPDLTAIELTELAHAELDAEKHACSAFGPTIDLMLWAREHGLPIVIVSDTYFSETELRELLAACIPSEALGGVERIFCSSEHGRSKGAGLFKDVLRSLGVPGRSLVHFGDHPLSDLAAAHAEGLHAVQLVHHTPALESALRTQALAMGLVAPEVRSERGLPRPYGALLSEAKGLESPEAALGYVSAGPVLYAFGHFVLRSLDELRVAGARPKPLFLLRDAYLPHRVCSELLGADAGPLVSLSRFVATAASLRSREDVERYLARSAGSGRFEPIARQLLLPPPVAECIIKASTKERYPALDFVRRVLEPKILTQIFERSRACRGRLFRYLERHVKLERGDTVVLVDLGYEGTVQHHLSPVFADELGVTVTGRYLLATRVPDWQKTRSGLFDPASVEDDRITGALMPHVALFEGLCTSDDASVVDYTETGEPVYDARVIAPEQYERLKPIQAQALRFVREAEAHFSRNGKRPDPDAARLTALAALTRLLFFPGEAELSYLEEFRLEMNLRTHDSYELFDRRKGLEALRKNGAFFMRPGKKTLRTNYPLELRGAGIELALALFAHRRFALNLGHEDVNLRREEVPILVVGVTDGVTMAEARATHDGYFALVLPVGNDFKIGVLFGRRYSYVQIHSIELLPVAGLYAPEGNEPVLDASSTATTDGMRDAGGGLFECLTEAAFVLIAPTEYPKSTSGVACRIVFRPVVPRLSIAAE